MRSRPPEHGSGSLVVGGGDVLGIFLGAALEGQEVVIAAAPAGEAPAQRGTRVVDGAAPLVGVEEAADAAEDVVWTIRQLTKRGTR